MCYCSRFKRQLHKFDMSPTSNKQFQKLKLIANFLVRFDYQSLWDKHMPRVCHGFYFCCNFYASLIICLNMPSFLKNQLAKFGAQKFLNTSILQTFWLMKMIFTFNFYSYQRLTNSKCGVKFVHQLLHFFSLHIFCM